MAPVHHRSTWLKQKNKGHKRSHRSKRAVNVLNGGKVQTFRGGRSRAGSTVSGIAKLGKKGRQNHAQMLRETKRNALFNKRRLGGVSSAASSSSNRSKGNAGAPRVVGIVSLNEHADAASFATMISGSNDANWIPGRPKTVSDNETKFRASFVVAERTILSVLVWLTHIISIQYNFIVCSRIL